jgi:putative transposase
MSRRPSCLVAQRHDALVQRIGALKAEHPFWGYRRLWADRRFVEPLPVHKQRMWRLMREHHLLVPPNLRLQAQRTPTRSQPKPTRPNEWWGIEMTQVLVEGVGWVSLVIVLDGYTKTMVGDHAGIRCPAQHGLLALDMAVNRQFPAGVQGHGLSLMSDHGCQPTSMAFMQACGTLGIQQAFTSDHNPKGNADTERMMRTLKEECLWLHEWTCPFAFASVLETWIAAYNEPYLHSTLGDKSPRQFEREYHTSHSPQFAVA